MYAGECIGGPLDGSQQTRKEAVLFVPEMRTGVGLVSHKYEWRPATKTFVYCGWRKDWTETRGLT